MADEQKPVEAPKEAPATETPAEETKAEDKSAEAEAPAAAEAATEAAPAEDKKEVKPVEEGTLDHKSAEAKLPKNFLYSKDAFWFGSDSVETDKLSSYVKTAKNVDVAHKNASWAASTGKGLLFVGPKDAPTGVINLAEASDVTTDGPVKFHFSASGFKHTFKAANKGDAENWVSQLKLKIEEAKASKDAVVATNAYKEAMEGFKPAKKEEKKEEAAAEPAKEEAKTEDAPKAEEAKEEPAKEEAKAEEPVKEEAKSDEEPKRRSASRKRESFMGFLKKKKEESKTEEKPAEDKPAEPAAAETPAEPATEAPAAAEEPAAEPAAAAEAKVEEPKEKPSIQKRGSIFSSFLHKKEKKTEEVAKEEAKTEEAAPTSETAPVIPPVETTTPLDTGISTAATVPTETTEVPATNGESKKEMKSEKRKSSIPFFGHKEKAEKSDGEEKTEKMSPFSKIRATIKGRAKAVTEKSEEKSAGKTESKPVETETVVPAKEEAPKPAEEEPVNKPEAAAPAAPVVTAAA